MYQYNTQVRCSDGAHSAVLHVAFPHAQKDLDNEAVLEQAKPTAQRLYKSVYTLDAHIVELVSFEQVGTW